jgi:hypothetical protein
VFTVVCFALYIPTILAVIKPIDSEAAGKEKSEEDNSGKIDFNVDFNAPDQSEKPDAEVEQSDLTLKPAKTKHKPGKKKK